MLRISNFLLFQAGWFACVLLGDAWAVATTLTIVLVHCLWVVRFSEISVSRELSWILCVLFCGLLLESLYFGAGILVRQDGITFPPIWLLCIWVLFATVIRFSLAWLRARLLLAAICAAISGPSSYYAGALMNVKVDIGQPIVFSLVFIGIIWLLVFPTLMFFSKPSIN